MEMGSQEILIYSIANSIVSKGKDPTKMDLSMFYESDRMAIYKKTADLRVQKIIKRVEEANKQNAAISISEEGLESIAKIYEMVGSPDSITKLGDMLLERDYPGDAATCYKLSGDKQGLMSAYNNMLESGNMWRIRDGAKGYREMDPNGVIDRLEKLAKDYMAAGNYEGAMGAYLELGVPYKEEILNAANKYLEKTDQAWYVENIYRSLGSKEGLAAVGINYLRKCEKKNAMKIFKEIGREDLIELAKQL